jgi:hypothetical protein
MNQHIADLIEKLHQLEQELDAALALRRAELSFQFEQGRVRFEQEIIRRHKELKTKLWPYIRSANPLIVLSAPVIYSLIVPLVILDVFVSLYHAICFPIYKIKKVKRDDYITFDRHHLAYLNIIEKINCAFCSYANGLIAYTREIASLTEAYWCPIKHAKRLNGHHPRYKEFLDYGDANAYVEKTKPRETPLPPVKP